MIVDQEKISGRAYINAIHHLRDLHVCGFPMAIYELVFCDRYSTNNALLISFFFQWHWSLHLTSSRCGEIESLVSSEEITRRVICIDSLRRVEDVAGCGGCNIRDSCSAPLRWNILCLCQIACAHPSKKFTLLFQFCFRLFSPGTRRQPGYAAAAFYVFICCFPVRTSLLRPAPRIYQLAPILIKIFLLSAQLFQYFQFPLFFICSFFTSALDSVMRC